MKTPLTKLEKYFVIDKLIIHSLDLCLYQASVVIDGEEHFVCYDDGNFLRTHSLIEIQKCCKNLKAKETVLRQESAYDEMVGAPAKGETNALEVPLKDCGLY
ncbi:DUF6482 family protein [Grimontia kaedaensis]|uniref:DUF6482 family protein n=1 Tax=Grimontia kaedaensis TaxID=2872157 RepID=A0ABY4X2N7_9GAMM|nr:DUF6482 family protein [Grimontia kaedaensis]USH05442.1 DUF6482 family protein [Grimontia kaedaensis]